MDKTSFLSSIDGHLGCLHFGAIVNEASVIICLKVFVWTCAFLWVDTRNGILRSYGKLLFNILETTKWLSKVIAPLYNTISDV